MRERKSLRSASANDPSRILDELSDLEYKLAELRLGDFVRASWDVLEPKTPLKWNWHHDYVCEHLEAMQLGQIQRLVINVPPRTMKSTITSICFPAWIWGPKNMPADKFLCGSYADSLARKLSIQRRMLMESPWYQRRWGDRFKFRDDLNTKNEYGNDKTGQMRSAGILGSVTGEGANWILFDDPHNPKKVESEVQRQDILDTIDTVWMSRLNDRDKDKVLLMMQRTHDDDAAAHLLATKEYAHVLLPLEEESSRTLYFPITKKTMERKEGDELHPARLGLRHKAQLIKDLGSWGFAAQYQQNPVPKSGGIIKRDWIKFYRTLPADAQKRIQSWDMAFKDTENSAYVVGQAWQKTAGNAYLVDQVRDKMGFSASCQAIISFTPKHPKAYRKLVEDKANGPAIIDQLKSRIPGIVPISVSGSKEARLEACSTFFEAGNVWLPHPDIAPWINDYIEELVRFPKAKYADQVDATTQALIDLFDPASDTLTKMVTL